MVAGDDAADALHRKLASVSPGDKRQVRHRCPQSRGRWTVSLRVCAVAGSAVGAKEVRTLCGPDERRELIVG
jgi:hypothetical protein